MNTQRQEVNCKYATEMMPNLLRNRELKYELIL